MTIANQNSHRQSAMKLSATLSVLALAPWVVQQQIVGSGNTYMLSTVEPLVLTSLDQLLLVFITFTFVQNKLP